MVNGLRGSLQQHLLLSVKPTSTWQNVREIVENYYSSTFVPNPTTGHIAYLAHGPIEDQLNYLKGRRKGKGRGKGGKGKKGGDYHKGKGKSKSKGKSGDNNKGKGKGYNKGGKGYYQGWNSWSQGGYNNNKGQGKSKGKGGKTGATTQCHVCKKFGHVAANCWYKDSTYTTAAVGSATTGQTQHFSMDNPANDQPVALMPRDQLPPYNQHGQCISGTYMQTSSALRAATSSTASYITTPGPVLHDISHVHCDGEIYDNHSMFEINYNRDLTSSMNHNYASELPAHYLKHWGLLVDTEAYVSVVPKALCSGGTTRESTTSSSTTHCYFNPHQDLWHEDCTTGYWQAFFPCSVLHHRREADTTGITRPTTRRTATDSKERPLIYYHEEWH